MEIKDVFLKYYRNKLNIFLLLPWLLYPSLANAEVQSWTLQSSVTHALAASPLARSADAMVGVRKGELEQASAWPNPTIALLADDKLGIQDGSGGTELKELVLSQPLPLRRLSRQRKQAEAQLSATQAQRDYQYLLLENTTAKAYHGLQLAYEQWQLAQRRMQLTTSPQQPKRGSRKTDAVVRYISPLERQRLMILQESAQQALAQAEGRYYEALTHFRTMLALEPTIELQLEPLSVAPSPQGLDVLQRGLEQHAALSAATQSLNAARAGVDVARSRRFADPSLILFQERDELAGRRQTITGIGLTLQIPLWNLNNGAVVSAKSQVYNAQAELQKWQRQLSGRLGQSYTHVRHLIEQASRYRENLLQPAQRVFDLTRKGFASGELGILALVDANDTYFSTQARYLELLQQGWVETAELRLLAGRPLSKENLAQSRAVTSQQFNREVGQ